MGFLTRAGIVLALCGVIQRAFALPPLVYTHASELSAHGVSLVRVALPTQGAVITITGGTGLSMTTRIYAFADSDRAVRRFAAYLVPKFSRSKGTVTLTAPQAPWPFSGWSHAPKVTVQLFLPPSVSIDYAGQSGTVEIRSRNARKSGTTTLNIRTSTGRVTVCHLRRAHIVNIRSDAGDVLFRGSAKDLKVRTNSGDIRALWIGGPHARIDLRSSTGKLSVGFVRPLNVQGFVGSTSGEVTLHGLSGVSLVKRHGYRLHGRQPALLLYARDGTGPITVDRQEAAKKDGTKACTAPASTVNR